MGLLISLPERRQIYNNTRWCWIFSLWIFSSQPFPMKCTFIWHQSLKNNVCLQQVHCVPWHIKLSCGAPLCGLSSIRQLSGEVTIIKWCERQASLTSFLDLQKKWMWTCLLCPFSIRWIMTTKVSRCLRSNFFQTVTLTVFFWFTWCH